MTTQRTLACVVLATAVSVIMCALAVCYNVTAIAKYRTDDLLTATKVTDFEARGTCVEVITSTQLKDAGFDHSNPSCHTDNTKGKQGSLRDALAASVHGLYYIGDSEEMRIAHSNVFGTVFTATLVGGDPVSVNFSEGYAALASVGEHTIPPSCDTIYGMTGVNTPDATNYLDLLRKGNGDTDWPLTDIPIRCNEHTQEEGTSNTVTYDKINAEETLKAKLYAHCLAQFQFAASGIGPFGVPAVGKVGGPNGFWYPNPSGFNSTAPYSTKARIYLGQRFGWSLFAYIPMLVTTCYLLADAVVYFIAEATETKRNDGAVAKLETNLEAARTHLRLEASETTIRAYRFTVGLVGVIVSCIFYTVFVVIPWHIAPFQSIETVMPRPICEEGTSDHKFGPIPIGYSGSRGGWQKDVDVTVYEIVMLFTQIFVLFLLPFTSSTYCFCNRTCFRKPNQGPTDIPEPQHTENGTIDARLHMLLTRGFGLVVFATIGILFCQGVSGAAFGMAWAIGVVGSETVTDDVTGVTSPAFDPVTIVDMVYQQTMATVSLTLVVGFTSGSILARYLIVGTTRFSALIFFLWVCIALLFWTPLIYYASVQASANEDCETFKSGYEGAKIACKVQFWTVLICGGFILLCVVAMILRGVFRNVPLCFEVSKKVNVTVSGYLRKAAKIFARKEPAYGQDVNASLGGFNVNGYRSPDQDFFNFKTGLTHVQEKQSLLRPVRMSFVRR